MNVSGIFKSILTLGVFCVFTLQNQVLEASDNYGSEKDPVGFYLNAGLLGDFVLKGYDSAVVERDPRIGYQVEIGGEFFAIPVSFSRGQGVDIYSVKPRLQYLFPFTKYFLSAGPGLGITYNYWTSDVGLNDTNFSVTAHELGAQPSLQIMIRPIRNLNILITPAAVDFNFWRLVEADSSIRGLGNFSTTNSDMGVVYTAGASVGLSF
jgi:hypothetical protein